MRYTDIFVIADQGSAKDQKRLHCNPRRYMYSLHILKPWNID